MKKLLLFFILPGFLFQNVHSQTFTDVASSCGINFQNGGIYGGGVNFCDFNKDGFDDLMMASTTLNPPGIFKNLNGSTYTSVTLPGLTNIAFSDCITLADYDNDGNEDALVTSFGGVTRLYHNNGDGTFTDVTSASGLSTTPKFATGACWGDYDNDGWLDLYICVYRGYMNSSDSIPDMLYHNEHNGTFTNRTVSAGLINYYTMPFVASFIDYNNDGWPDLYVASDHLRGNKLYKNNGNGTFTDVSASSQTNLQGESMGIAIGDYDNNGYLDMYISNGESGNFMLKNNGNGTFSEVAATLGIGVYKISWGNSFLDYNNDGFLDLYVAVSNGAPDCKNMLFKNNGNGTFTRIQGIGMDQQCISYGMAIGDMNNDGYPDIAVSNYGEPMNLYKNSGGTNKWLKVNLRGNVSNRDGIGSIIEVYRGTNKYIRPVTDGNGYLSQNSQTQMLGLGSYSTVDSLIIKWPSGWRTRMDNVAANQTISIDENNPIGIHKNGNEIPSSFDLKQNYPNPFNPSTKIEYSIPKQETVKIEVYDVIGNKLRDIVSETKPAGMYVVEFNANNLSSGIYFYKMTAGEFVKVNKMILVK